MKRCYIFSGSPVAELPLIEDIKDIENAFVYCADGGCRYAEQLGIVPDVVIGDFDTYSEALEKYTNARKFKKEKDETDTMLAIIDAIEKDFDEIIILAALGGRFDHSFANLEALNYIASHGKNGFIKDKNNIITIQYPSKKTYPKKDGWYFSLFAFGDRVKNLTVKNTKYEVCKIELKNNFPLGVSNEITGDFAEVEFDEGILLVIYSKD